jgi:glycosyltransferase involved in cell wall biosynthesis
MTLDSLVTQKSKYEFEVIVADDGSADNTKAVVDKYIGRLNISYCFHEDKGFRASATRNMGIKLSRSPLCIFIDNGIILHSKAVEAHVEVHLSEKSPCVVLGYVYGFEVERGKESELEDIIAKNTPDEAIRILNEKQFYDRRESYYRELGDELHNWPAPFLISWTCNLSVPKDILMSVGMFDEYFTSWGGEDNDLGLSLLENNVKFVLSRKASSVHFPHEKSGQWETNFEAESARAKVKMEYMLKKHPIRAMELWMSAENEIQLNRQLLAESNTD